MFISSVNTSWDAFCCSSLSDQNIAAWLNHPWSLLNRMVSESALWRQRQEDLYEFQASLVYIVGSSSAWATSWDPVSKDKNTGVTTYLSPINSQLSFDSESHFSLFWRSQRSHCQLTKTTLFWSLTEGQHQSHGAVFKTVQLSVQQRK